MHRPGAIQPHGRLLVIEDGELRGRSANVAQGTLRDLLGKDAAARLLACIDRAPETAVLENVEMTGLVWSALLHPTGRGALVELEPAQIPGAAPLRILDEAIADLRRAADTRAACAVAARAVATLTGFDRVIACRFLPDSSGPGLRGPGLRGEVAAEALRPGTDGFLGLRFPAADIPAQARARYASPRVQTILDRSALPVSVAAPHRDLDLSRCVLRAVSPADLRHLARMDVRASMSVALLTADDVLWGLLACHHRTGPLFIGHALRQAADTIGRALAWRLAEIGADEEARGRRRLSDLCESLAAGLADPGCAPDAILSPLAGRLLAVAEADGFALAGPGLSLILGRAPALDAADLARALERLPPESLVSDRLPDGLDPAIASGLSHAGLSGILAERIADGSPGTWAVWMRCELRRTVDLAGNPDAGATSELPGPTPRHPFAAADRAAARAVADIVRRGLLRRADTVERLNAELRQRHDDLRFFTDAAVHDLREPLWQLQVFSGTLSHDLAAASVDTRDLLETASIIESSAARMKEMIDELSLFAAAGRRSGSAVPVPLAELLDEAVADLSGRLRACGATLAVDLPPFAIAGDRVQLRRLFQNLLSNAIKYRAPDRPLAIKVAGSPAAPGRLRVTVADNGQGFDGRESERIFEPFRRLGRVSRDGMGLGLAICRRIAEAHGGTIEAWGREGEGARLTIELPGSAR